MRLFTEDKTLKNTINVISKYIYIQKNYKIILNWNKNDKVSWHIKDDIIEISCETKNDAINALGDALSKGYGSGILKKRFKNLDVMIDVSRNAVYTVEYLKRFLCQIALMGYSGIMLYMEDTYELENYPYWGYQRGRYTTEELKEIDDFAHSLGIELIACIQTLAHLRTALRWDCFKDLKDTPDNLLVGSKQTEKLIRDILLYFKNTLRTNRIHLGMDESCSLGTGRYRQINGFKDHKEIVREHLKIVCEICKEYDLKPMIWDDMLFRDDTPEMDYYAQTPPITIDEMKKYPDNLSFVYWDYYHNTKEEYITQLKRRGQFKTIFAGGIWKWGGFTPNYTKSFKSSLAAMNACYEHNVDEIIVTAWGDDGAEAPLECLLAGFALYGIGRFNNANIEDTQRFCKLLVDCELDMFKDIEKLDLIPNMPSENLEASMPHKMLLYADIASDRYLYNMNCSPSQLVKHYENVEKIYKKYLPQNDNNINTMMNMYYNLANVLKIRCKTGILIHESWKNKNENMLREAQIELENLICIVKDFHKSVVDMWSLSCKGQGLEIIDLRLGGLCARYDTIKRRIEMYLKGEIETLTELDDDILETKGENSEGLKRELYADIVTVNSIHHINIL